MNQPLPRYVDYMYSYPHKTAYRSFPSPVSLLPYLEQVEEQKASLYFHIPFCSHKCGYCNLFSLQTNRADYIATYLETLHKQAQQLSPLTTGLIFNSFAIGGGTPLLLTVSQLEYLLETAALFGVHPSHAFTSIETSPEYADPARLTWLKQAGVILIRNACRSPQIFPVQRTERTPVVKSIGRFASLLLPHLRIEQYAAGIHRTKCHPCSLAIDSFLVLLVTGLLLTFYRVKDRSFFMRFTSYGKMSLTNYLGQSIFGSFLFYHWGFELGRYLGITYSFLFGILFVLLQMVFCSWWLRHHKHGPFEGLWKRLTWIGKNK